ncbi:hypothetical protein WK07_04320 [Burkholderia multivorans]|uniref:hypothetical protein n=1 Tax=Burkholderia multivorans TaxID=87883 RepID=UPI0007536F69|nr:hypothetical protein [Burkholderia multivorans]KVQ85528.1 hypothetical protein WK07_04320 [Burkholderia multivorans]
MKPFDLEAAKRGEPLVTRDGRKVQEFHYFATRDDWRVCAVIHGDMICCGDDGRFSLYGRDDPSDLFMAPRKRTVYVNVYATSLNNDDSPGTVAAAFDTEEGAKLNARHDRAGLLAIAVPIEIEE